MNVIPLEARALSVLGDTSVQLVRASVIPRRPIHWLWPGWLARGKLHLLAGAPGTGKTTLALTLAATISRGRSWPDGTAAAGGQVLIWSGEDDPADTLVPRLHAAGADLDRIFIVGDTWIEGEPRAFDPARDLAALESQAAVLGDIALLIADPVVSAVTGDSHKNTEVRRALQPLVYLAARLNCAVLGITHFSKNTSGRDPTERVTGSVAFGALARLVLVTAQDKHGERVLARAKSNIGPDGGGFAYTLEQQCCDGMEASRIVWGDRLQGCARELLSVAEASSGSARDDAAAWLSDMLAGAEVAVKVLQDEAKAAGLSWRTLVRAKSEIGATALRVSDGKSGKGHWCWQLPCKSITGKEANSTSQIGTLAETVAGQALQIGEVSKDANVSSGTHEISSIEQDTSRTETSKDANPTFLPVGTLAETLTAQVFQEDESCKDANLREWHTCESSDQFRKDANVSSDTREISSIGQNTSHTETSKDANPAFLRVGTLAETLTAQVFQEDEPCKDANLRKWHSYDRQDEPCKDANLERSSLEQESNYWEAEL